MQWLKREKQTQHKKEGLTITEYFDNTMITEFRRCPRRYFFRHCKNWVKSGDAPLALIFGSSWHAAMDSVWMDLCNTEVHFATSLTHERDMNLSDLDIIDRGYEAFCDKWVEEGLLHPDTMHPDDLAEIEPRSPIIAQEMLHEYVAKRKKLLGNLKLIATEQPFAVPLHPTDETIYYIGRFDKVIENRGAIYIVDHKTTSLYSAGGPFRYTFIESFSPNTQIDGYLHAAHILWGNKVKGAWIDAALVHKTVHDGFGMFPIERAFAHLDSWLWETHYWVDQIRANQRTLPNVLNERYLAAFPKNTNSCTDFGKKCPYLDVCKSWGDPQRHVTPPDFEEEQWSPFDLLNVEQLGLEK